MLLVQLKDFFVLTPVLSLISGGLILILIQILVGRLKLVLAHIVTFIAIFVSILSILFFLLPQISNFFVHFISTGFEYKLDTQVFQGHVVWNHYAAVYALLISVCLFIFTFIAKNILKKLKLDLIEIYEFILFTGAGFILFVMSNNLITSFIALELSSLPLFVLIAINREKKHSVEAGIKYFLLSVFATSFFLLGIAFIYGATSSVNLVTINSILQDPKAPVNLFYLKIGLAFLSIGMLFKLGVFPLHGWVADVYEGSLTIVTSLMASIAKVSIIGFSFKLLSAFHGDNFSKDLYLAIVVFSIASMLYGNIVALVQNNLKRMFAYSSIAHAGYLGLILAITSIKAYQVEASGTIFFYIFGYCVASLLSFSIIAYLELQKENQSILLEDIKGLAYKNPYAAFGLSISALSLAGIPPLIGFYGKLYIIKMLLNAHMYVATFFIAVSAILGIYYYIRVFINIYLEEDTNFVTSFKITTYSEKISIISLILIILVCGICSGSIISFIEKISGSIL